MSLMCQSLAPFEPVDKMFSNTAGCGACGSFDTVILDASLVSSPPEGINTSTSSGLSYVVRARGAKFISGRSEAARRPICWAHRLWNPQVAVLLTHEPILHLQSAGPTCCLTAKQALFMLCNARASLSVGRHVAACPSVAIPQSMTSDT